MNTAHDPAFAAIERHRIALAAFNAAFENAAEARAHADQQHGQCPSTLITWKHRQIGGSEIEAQRDRLLLAIDTPAPGYASSDILKHNMAVMAAYLDAKALEIVAITASREWHDRSGIAPFLAAEEEAERALDDARKLLSVTAPATAKGAAAIIYYILHGMEIDEADELRDYEKAALRMVAASLANQPE